jgi:integration host factor subunit beta
MALKNNLIKALNKQINYLSREDAESSVNVVIDYLKEQLVKENRIEIRGFGSFSIRKRKKVGSDDEFYNTVYFRMAKTISEKLNKL